MVFLVFLVLRTIFRTVLVESPEIVFVFLRFFVIRGTGESRNIVATGVFLVLKQRQKAEKVHAHSPPFC